MASEDSVAGPSGLAHHEVLAMLGLETSDSEEEEETHLLCPEEEEEEEDGRQRQCLYGTFDLPRTHGGQ